MTIDEKSFFMEGTVNICSHLEIEAAMFACLKTVSQVMPADGLYMQYYDKEADALRIVAKATKEGSSKVDALVPLSPEGKEFITISTTLFSEDNLPNVLIYNRPETDPICRSMLKFHGVIKEDSSLLIMLLGIEDTLFGSITLHAFGHDQFTEKQAHYFSLLRDPFRIAVSNARKHLEVTRLKDLLADDNRYLHREMLKLSGDQIIGREFGLKPVMDMVKHVAEHKSPVLLLGETGAGKDIIANAIHYSSTRSSGPFVTVNCGAIPGTLLDSELFGHERGAFTGALSQKRGRFERADKGTIFLDEIGELTPEAQVRLLRVLQNSEIERVGGTKTIHVDIRVIAATNQNLEQMVVNRQFREDLWFRLNVFPIMIPPLRARKTDIPALVDYLFKKKISSLKLRRIPVLAEGSMDQLMAYHWPGNVRELENVIERALILNKTGPISFDIPGPEFLPMPVMEVSQKESKLPSFHQNATDYLNKVLMISGGKINGPEGAASLAELNPSTLRNKLKKLGIPFGLENSVNQQQEMG